MSLFNKITSAVGQWRRLKKMPLHLEFIVTDYCNLNCRGCTHYSPLARKEFAAPDDLKRDIAHLGRVCGEDVREVYLIGGETLLYPDLVDAMDALRAAFPTQGLCIFTNGLILGRMDDEFWSSARRNGAIIAITRYPVKFDYDEVEALCVSKGVEVQVFGDRTRTDSFFRFALDPSGSQNRYLSHFKCYNRGCVSVVDGYVYPCSISACVKHLNRGAGTSFEHREGDRIAVGEIKNAAQIRRLRDHAVPFCSYCKNPPSTVAYALSKRQASEWVD